MHDLIAGQFIVENCGAHQLAGVARPVQLYRPLAPSGVRRSWGRVRVRGPTLFVNRKHEIETLSSSWRSARNGAGQFVLMAGEPGIGKSRLVEEFRSSVRDTHSWMECAGERFSESVPFQAATKLLEQALDLEKDESAEVRMSQLKRAIRSSGLDLSVSLPLIAEMLKLPPSQEYLPLQIEPEQARGSLLACLVEWMLKLARLQPLVLVIEDLHWVDPSSVELIGKLIEQSRDVPLMLIATARLEFSLPWEQRAIDKMIVIGRLSNDEIGAMIAGSSGTDGLTEEVLAGVVKRSDGVPLFAEELLSFVVEGEGDTRVKREIPATLLDSLTARLDRLGPVRKVAQVAAVLGREFDYPLFRAVVSGSDQYVQSALEALIRADLIYTNGKLPRANYQFKHALIRDAAYEGLLKSERRELHARVARTMCEQFPALAAQPVLLARHWTEAGETKSAIEAWKNAGQAALARCAFKEAEEAYRQANAALGRLPPSETRDKGELDLCSALVRVLQVTKGYSAAETMQLGVRARVLAERLGDLTQLVRQGARTWASIFFTGDYATAASLAKQILEIALTEASSSHLFFAQYAQVQASFYKGDLAGVEDHFAKLSPLLDTKSIAAASYLDYPNRSCEPCRLAARAVPTLARERITRAMGLAKKSGDPYAMAMALHFKGNLYWCLKAPRRAETIANRLLQSFRAAWA